MVTSETTCSKSWQRTAEVESPSTKMRVQVGRSIVFPRQCDPAQSRRSRRRAARTGSCYLSAWLQAVRLVTDNGLLLVQRYRIRCTPLSILADDASVRTALAANEQQSRHIHLNRGLPEVRAKLVKGGAKSYATPSPASSTRPRSRYRRNCLSESSSRSTDFDLGALPE